MRMSVAEICASTLPSRVLDHGVHGGLRVNHDINLGRREIEQPACLDHLESFVHQSGAIDGDAVAHLPCWMIQGLLGSHRGERLAAGCCGTDRPRRSGSAWRPASRLPARRHWWAPLCSLSTGQTARLRTPARPPSPGCRPKPALLYSPVRPACRGGRLHRWLPGRPPRRWPKSPYPPRRPVAASTRAASRISSSGQSVRGSPDACSRSDQTRQPVGGCDNRDVGDEIRGFGRPGVSMFRPAARAVHLVLVAVAPNHVQSVGSDRARWTPER